jgi:arylsulfatase A-like enzyme
MDVTRRMRHRWRGVRFSHPWGRPRSDASLQQTIRRRYAAMIEVVDGWLGEMMRVLDETGARQDTLIVFASDHGEMLGDHNLWGKLVPFEASVTVPLVMAGPMVSGGGRRSGAPVSLIDLAATMLDLAGMDPRPHGDGVSLLPILSGAAETVRPYAFSGLGGWRAVTDGRFKLVAGFDTSLATNSLQSGSFDPASTEGSIALYDLRRDGWEAEDVSWARPDKVEELWAALIANEKQAIED